MKKTIVWIVTLVCCVSLAGGPCLAAAGGNGAAEEAAAGAYEFNPHLYVPLLAQDIPQDYWDSFHNLCDALRAGEDTFVCSSEAAYKWATDPATLTELFPAACTRIRSGSSGGMARWENGVGYICYEIPAGEYAERQAAFEAKVTEVLNDCLEPDDDDYEKCLKLFDYLALHYSYDYDTREDMSDGANYLTIMTGKGKCIQLGSVFAYFLLQAGVEAVQVGCTNDEIAHAWTYIVLDGKGYHSDLTWALRSDDEGDDLSLYYFLMDGQRRADSGCAVDDLTSPLLPRYWANQSAVSFDAEDSSRSFPSGSFLIWIDEEHKTVRYLCDSGVEEFRYARN